MIASSMPFLASSAKSFGRSGVMDATTFGESSPRMLAHLTALCWGSTSITITCYTGLHGGHSEVQRNGCLPCSTLLRKHGPDLHFSPLATCSFGQRAQIAAISYLLLMQVLTTSRLRNLPPF